MNPFGLAWDARGDLYSADCHSAPIYQLLPGAVYPSFGKPDDGLNGPADVRGKAVTGEEFRAGYEAINMTEARLAEIGIAGMLAPRQITHRPHFQRRPLGARARLVFGWLRPLARAIATALDEAIENIVYLTGFSEPSTLVRTASIG